MKAPTKIIATVVAATIAASSMTAPAFAIYYPPKKIVKVVPKGGSGSGAGPYVVGCIFGSALGLIVAALKKKTGELTTQEAQLIAFTCGLGFFPVVANFQQPIAVKAKN